MARKNEDLKARIRLAYQECDANAFNQWVMMLLHRGYSTRLGKRGGLSFPRVGASVGGREEARAAMAVEFAPHFVPDAHPTMPG